MNSVGPNAGTLLIRLMSVLLALNTASWGGRTEEGIRSAFAKGESPGVQSDAELSVTIVGIVVREDGTAPPFGVVIEHNCGDGYKKDVEADNSGFFSFRIGKIYNAGYRFLHSAENSYDSARPPESSTIATQTQPPSSVNLLGCEVRALAPGYHSNTVRITGDAASSKIDIGSIILCPNKKSKGSAVSVAGLQIPKAAKKAMDRARSSIGKRDFVHAEKHLKAVLDIDPKYAEAWFWLGWVHEQQRRYQESRTAYEKAIEVDRNYARPYIGLAQLAGIESQWQKVLDFSGQALALDPLHFPEAYFINALAYYQMNNLEAAERSALKEQQVDTDHRIPKIHLLLADILFKKDDRAGSIQEMRTYLALAPSSPDADAVRRLLRRREITK